MALWGLTMRPKDRSSSPMPRWPSATTLVSTNQSPSNYPWVTLLGSGRPSVVNPPHRAKYRLDFVLETIYQR